MKARAEAIWRPQPNPNARVRLLCFPYAGSGASVFRSWDLGTDIEVSAMQLPGREWRRDELPITRMDALVANLLPAVLKWLDDPRPALFFGYSMGAALSYALTVRLQKSGARLPDALFVAACRAPQLLTGTVPVSNLNDEDFVSAIRRFGGMPDAILAEPELLQLDMPVLRADFEVLGTYQLQLHSPLSCPLTVYGGSEDPHATRTELAQWRGLTANEFQLRIFSGGHFFINEARAQLLKTLAADISPLIVVNKEETSML
jgi:surfactin synthase thioesterase subunit